MMNIFNWKMFIYGDLLVRVHCSFTKYGEQYEGGTRQKKESSEDRIGSLKKDTDQMTDPKLRVDLFDSTVLPALCYAARRGMILRSRHDYCERLTKRSKRCLVKSVSTHNT
ncbi:hypothetical protein KIN20_020605 [Parelaphostrongylus tenuis]|uniref:Uncharacterized protein n=1 Tax=Parelaphostrongylus tenuis TaxID=148309 RepID=A0AAD5QTL5_PARTN|nr:hypothetical protein KIN20_020605 [Parelaphostrongylus tenuis]